MTNIISHTKVMTNITKGITKSAAAQDPSPTTKTTIHIKSPTTDVKVHPWRGTKKQGLVLRGLVTETDMIMMTDTIMETKINTTLGTGRDLILETGTAWKSLENSTEKVQKETGNNFQLKYFFYSIIQLRF